MGMDHAAATSIREALERAAALHADVVRRVEELLADLDEVSKARRLPPAPRANR